METYLRIERIICEMINSNEMCESEMLVRPWKADSIDPHRHRHRHPTDWNVQANV